MSGFRVGAMTFGLVLISFLAAVADEQPTHLPEDGWWIKFGATTRQEANGVVIEVANKSTYSLVGRVTEDGEACRWVECHSVSSSNKVEHVIISKVLVPEKALLEAEQPYDSIKRGWVKVNQGKAQELKVVKGTNSEELLFIFPGMWKNAERKARDKVVDYQHGRLKMSEAKTRQVTVNPAPDTDRRVIPGDRKRKVEYTIWFDPSTTPVFAAAKIQRKVFWDDELKFVINEEMVVEDQGAGAKSKLPDKN